MSMGYSQFRKIPLPVNQGGTNATSASITAFNNITGLSATGSTGTGNLVLSSSPTVSSITDSGHPTFEGVTSTGATGTGKFVFDNAPTLSGHPTIEGVTSTGATGTGKLVFDTSPVLITPTRAATPSIYDNSLALATTAYIDRYITLPAAIWFREDFSEGTSQSVTTSASYGNETNWHVLQVTGGTQTVAATTGTFSNPGQCLMTTSGTSGQGVVMWRAGPSTGNASFGALGSNAGWEAHFIYKLGATTNICSRVGFVVSTQHSADPPSSWFGIEYDTANTGNSDTKFTWVTRSSATPSYSTTNSVNADTSFHHFRIRSTSAGTIGFTIDGGTEYTTSSNVSTSGMMLFMQLITRTSGASTMTMDFASYFANTGRT